MTEAPADASARAAAAPNPAPAPVTRADRPASENTCKNLLALLSSELFEVILVAPWQAQHVGAQVIEDHFLTDGCNPGQTSFSEVACRRVLFGITHATMRLKGSIRCIEACVSAQILRHIRFFSAGFTLVVKPGGFAQHELCCLEARQRVRERELDALVLANW